MFRDLKYKIYRKYNYHAKKSTEYLNIECSFDIETTSTIINDDKFIDFLKMFPRAGETGTLKSFLNDTSLQGRFVAKTGSLNKVQCYAGYMLDELGVPTHVVVVMINGFKENRAKLKETLQNLLIQNLISDSEQ